MRVDDELPEVRTKQYLLTSSSYEADEMLPEPGDWAPEAGADVAVAREGLAGLEAWVEGAGSLDRGLPVLAVTIWTLLLR